jgi:membrane fusion protein, adhesin transport system
MTMATKTRIPNFAEFPALPAMKLVKDSPRARSVAWLLALGLAAAAMALVFVPWQQNIPGEGRMVALTPVERQQTVDTPIDGRVLRWHVAEGSRVKAGDLLAEISDNDPSILGRMRDELRAQEERLVAARQREFSLGDRISGLEGSRRNAISAADSRVDMAGERLRASERALEAAVATVATAKLNLDRQQGLHKKGLTPTRQVELAQLDYDRGVAEVERGKAGVNSARQELEALKADRLRTENDFRASIQDAKASRASALAEVSGVQAGILPVQTRIARQTTQEVRAPRGGVVLRLLAQPGSEMLKAGDPVMILVPESGNAVVELWVSGNDMPLVSRGNKVRLQFEGWPAIQFVGWPSVAVGTFGGIVTLVDETDNGKGKFRLLVAADPADQPWPTKRYLRQGVRANGWVLLNQVKLGFEVWRQLNGFPPVIAAQEPPSK